MVNVLPDPMVDLPLSAYQAKASAYKEIEKIVRAANEGWARIQEVKSALRRVDAALGLAPDSTRQQLARMGRSMQDSIAALEKLYMMPDGLKGIQRSSDNVNGMIQGALSYLGASDADPNQAAQRMIARANDYTANALEKINAFIGGTFDDYRKKVQVVQVELFKAMEPLKMN
jgi:hypothetical protein